ncbi:MAG: Lrp/AsnC family transcriptional regulator [Firmicutes bacterium]|nr:Lrp/AsnC family transcriptional regulator [Bacillota bacterium]
MLTDQEKKIVRELQNNIPLVKRPFEQMARGLGMEEQELLDKIEEFRQRGILRRFGATVRHQNLGYTANAMVVWDIPDDQVEEAGKTMAQFPEVSHCYQRPTHPGWPYKLFTVVHGKTRSECEEKAWAIAQKTGYHNYKPVFSTRELKKSSMKYFED